MLQEDSRSCGDGLSVINMMGETKRDFEEYVLDDFRQTPSLYLF
jgi:hypothetical protein